MNKQVSQIVSKALDGGEITSSELECLLQCHYLSEEAYYVQYAARKIADTASQGFAEVHGQVGLNVGPCPRNCQFCSFAQINGVFPKEQQYSVENIVERALRLEADGASALYLMATAAYDFAQYIDISTQVRAALKTDIPMVANVDDFDDDRDKQLKKAGYAGIYHAVRFREGNVTLIPLELRLKTIAAAQNAGLQLGTCIEPVGPEHTPAEIAEVTMLSKSFSPVHGGLGRREHIPGSKLEVNGIVTRAHERFLVAATTLAYGYSVKAHANLNLRWAESGSNPRDTKADTTVGVTVAKRREELEEEGWKILSGRSRLFAS